ncbi:hypothetical protein EYC84_006942 [Monilinia fructicola]|uniref:Uncharacterized protein n=1 Tax=Monilinia fructicola TaxID=38448 RepID=A0A5M9K9X7_MONFR|nr:hypothetical protein EYC84_006942 [Monilinia fructicola]
MVLPLLLRVPLVTLRATGLLFLLTCGFPGCHKAHLVQISFSEKARYGDCVGVDSDFSSFLQFTLGNWANATRYENINGHCIFDNLTFFGFDLDIPRSIECF